MSRAAALASAVAFATALAAGSASALPRVFVASTGSDANSCTPASPCRSFARALNAVDAGGEIVALDAAGYGPVTIGKSVTISANPGVHAGIAVSGGAAVSIFSPGVRVVLRGLALTGTGATASNGVEMTEGDRLSIENCVVSGFHSAGAAVLGAIVVRIVDSIFRDDYEGIVLTNGATGIVSRTTVEGSYDAGVSAEAMPSAITRLSLSDSTISGNGEGIVAFTTGGASDVSVIRTSISGNSIGVETYNNGSGSPTISIGYSQVVQNGVVGLAAVDGTIRSLGNNMVQGNGTDMQGTITAQPGM